jgi:hypothetical protein
MYARAANGSTYIYYVNSKAVLGAACDVLYLSQTAQHLLGVFNRVIFSVCFWYVTWSCVRLETRPCSFIAFNLFILLVTHDRWAVDELHTIYTNMLFYKHCINQNIIQVIVKLHLTCFKGKTIKFCFQSNFICRCGTFLKY